MIGATIIMLTGFIDDKFQIKPWQKMLRTVYCNQSSYYQMVCLLNILTVPFLEQSVQVSLWIAIPITDLWIMGVTNSVNLIDGLDG